MLFDCESDARRKQWRFMNRHLGLAQPLSVIQLWNSISEMRRYLRYLPNPNPNAYLLQNEKLRDLLVASMPKAVEELMQQANFQWEDVNKTDIEVVTYLNQLQTILNKSVRHIKGKREDKVPHKKNNQYKSRRNNGNGKDKKVCNYCTKKKGKTWYGHTESECRNKKKDE